MDNKTRSLCCLQETHLRSKDTQTLKVKGWEIYLMKVETKQKS